MPPAIAEQAQIVVPIITFFLGFFTSRFTLSKADRLSNERAKFALSKEMAESQNAAYNDLMAALTRYASETGPPTLNDFFEISRSAQNYLYQQKMVADAILAGRVDVQSRDATFVPKLVDTADRLVPKLYATLKKIADKHGLPYPDEFQRGDYQSIFDAVEKYGRSNPLKPPAANNRPTGGSPAMP